MTSRNFMDIRNYALFKGPLSLLKKFSPKHKDYMFFFIFLSKKKTMKNTNIYWKRFTNELHCCVTVFPWFTIKNEVIMTSRLRCSIFLIAAFDSAHKIMSDIENFCCFFIQITRVTTGYSWVIKKGYWYVSSFILKGSPFVTR